jgi:mono/diheme cytochrome c family protein
LKIPATYLSVLASCLALAVLATKIIKTPPCWCWDRGQSVAVKAKLRQPSKEYTSYGSYGVEADWTNPERLIPLNYDQAQGQRIFYQQCVWCHAETTPAGPSNRNNVIPLPPLLNDGSVLNRESDASLEKIISLGGGAVGRSPMMPPHGKLLTQEEIADVVRFIRVIAVPEYHRP